MTARGHTSPKLFGRRRELAALDQMLKDARNGQSAVLVLRGESGVGKTALLEHLLNRASDVHSDCRHHEFTGAHERVTHPNILGGVPRETCAGA